MITNTKFSVGEIVKNAIITIGNQEDYIAELERKYNKIISFIKELSKFNDASENYTTTINTFGFQAKKLLEELGEIND